MRIATCAALLLLLNTAAHGQVHSNYAGLYRDVALKTEDEAERCATILASVQDGPHADANARMEDEGCFDDPFTGFFPKPAPEAAVNTNAQVWIDGGLLHVKIAGFDKGTGVSLFAEIGKIGKDRTASFGTVVLDLRGNRGGDVAGAESVLAAFSPGPGIEYLHAQSKCGNVGAFAVTTGTGPLSGKRYIILIDGKTASSSEIVVATLKFEWYPHATNIVGVKARHTYGKNLMQAESRDELFFVTCGEWFITTEAGQFPLLRGFGIEADETILDLPKCGLVAECIVATIEKRRRSADASKD